LLEVDNKYYPTIGFEPIDKCIITQ
jgi:hypothetical protein